MPAGLQVFGADGSLQVDTGTRLTRVIGTMVRSEPHVHGGEGNVIPWPYPAIPGNRVVAVVSKNPKGGVWSSNSPAWAFYRASTGMVHFDRGDDDGPITLIFMVY